MKMRKTASNNRLDGRSRAQTTVKERQKIKFREKREVKNRALKDLQGIFEDGRGVSGQRALESAPSALMRAGVGAELGGQSNHSLDV